MRTVGAVDCPREKAVLVGGSGGLAARCRAAAGIGIFWRMIHVALSVGSEACKKVDEGGKEKIDDGIRQKVDTISCKDFVWAWLRPLLLHRLAGEVYICWLICCINEEGRQLEASLFFVSFSFSSVRTWAHRMSLTAGAEYDSSCLRPLRSRNSMASNFLLSMVLCLSNSAL